MPTMKIGSGAAFPPGARQDISAVKSCDAPIDELGQMSPDERVIFAVVAHCRRNNGRTPHRSGPQSCSAFPSANSRWKRSSSLRSVRASARFHRRDVRFGEPNRLEVGQAPPGLAQRRIDRDRLAIGGNRLVRAARPSSACAHSSASTRGWFGRALQHFVVKLERLLEIAEPSKRRSLEVQVTQVVRLGFENLVEKLERFGGRARAGREPSRGSRCAAVKSGAISSARRKQGSRSPSAARPARQARRACGSPRTSNGSSLRCGFRIRSATSSRFSFIAAAASIRRGCQRLPMGACSGHGLTVAPSAARRYARLHDLFRRPEGRRRDRFRQL